MSKLKLKSVQSTRSGGQLVGMMHWGDLILYLDESGNWVDDSGNIRIWNNYQPIDDSGNVQDEGWLGVYAGYQIVNVTPEIVDPFALDTEVEITWGSGSITLPFLENRPPEPIVPVTIRPLGNLSLSPHWITPLTVRLDHEDTKVDLFTLPYEYHAPSNNDNE